MTSNYLKGTISMEKTGYIYVLTNESFHRENWIKIGYAEDVDRRVRELSNTSVPLPYEVYCTYEIPRINLIHLFVFLQIVSFLKCFLGMHMTCFLPLHRCMGAQIS